MVGTIGAKHPDIELLGLNIQIWNFLGYTFRHLTTGAKHPDMEQLARNSQAGEDI